MIPLIQLAAFAAIFMTVSMSIALAAPDIPQVLGYHGSAERSGNFVMPALTFDKARALHSDPAFHGQVSGAVYAQPLYWQAPGGSSAMLVVATENDQVYALDATTGAQLWQRTLGQPVPCSALPCGNINPLGITGTPVIDPETQTLYVEAPVADAGQTPPFRHLVFALSLKDGSVLPGWPVDVAAALQKEGHSFDIPYQDDRGALTLMNGTIYVPFGGHYGDCGPYHGWIVGIASKDPGQVTSWETSARGGGIWAPGGISSDGTSLFAVTGNTFGVTSWGDGEAVFRYTPDLAASTSARDYFAPADWLMLDRLDADLGGTNAMPFDLDGAGGTQHLLLALGKDGRAYVLDRANLGGIGGALAGAPVSSGPIRTGPALYSGDSGTYIAFQGAGSHCPDPARRGELTVLEVKPGTPPSLTTAWCGAMRGAGSPIVTTTDGRANPIVWILGAEGDNRLHGFRGDTGEPIFTGGGAAEAMSGLHHFETLIAAGGRLYVGADNRLYAFTF